MARVKSYLQIDGGLNDLCFYQLNGKPIVRTIGRVSKERYRNAAAFKRMRENMTEFGAASYIGKTVCNLFAPYSKTLADTHISGRLNGVIRKMISNGSGEPGKRAFDILKYKSILEGFEFNPQHRLSEAFNGPFTLTTNDQRNEAVLTLPDVDWTKHITAPEGATHLRLVCAIGCLSGYMHTGQKYEPSNTNLNGLAAVEVTSEIPIGENFSPILNLNPQLPGIPVLAPDVCLISCLGICFLQEANGFFYPMAQGKAMKVVGVF